jgi:hypothetical protein
MPSNPELATIARRGLFPMGVAGSVTVGLGLASGLVTPRRTRAQSALTPDEALHTGRIGDMYSLSWLLRVAAVVCFGLATVGAPARVNLVALGLCLFALSSVVA